MPIITELKTVKIDHECKDNPVFLTWLNSLGGFSYWLFSRESTETSKTQINTAYNPNITDLENATGTGDIIGKSVSATLQIGGRITAEDMPGIRGLYESSKVQLLTNPLTWETDGPGGTPLPKWNKVTIQRGSLIVLKTRTSALDVKLTLSLPSRNKQQE